MTSQADTSLPGRASHFIFLDYLRTIAIALVLLRHTIRPVLSVPESSGAVIKDGIWPIILNFMENGWLGVDLFFILSGFLIAHSFSNNIKGHVKKFYKNRALRILPAYYFVLGLILLGVFPFYTVPQDGLLRQVFLHAIFMQDYTGAGINVVYWSLGVEIKFYLIAPLFLYFLNKWAKKEHWYKGHILLLILTALGPLARAVSWYIYGAPEDYTALFFTYRSPLHCCLDALMVGVWGHFLYRQFKDKPSFRILWMIQILSLTGLLSYLGSHVLLESTSFWEIILQPLFISMAMAGLAVSGLLLYTGLKKNSPIQIGARISYSLYLVHWPLIPLSLMLPKYFNLPAPHLSFLSFGVSAAFLWGSSIALAFLIYKYIERPFLKLKHRAEASGQKSPAIIPVR
jgi:peptidoglycan/LPS O-acetylase OafA/YrhL